MARRRQIQHQLMYAIEHRLRVDILVRRQSRPTHRLTGVPVELVSIGENLHRVVIDPGERPDGTYKLVDLDCIEQLRQSRLSE